MSEFTARYLADYRAPSFETSTVQLTFDLEDTSTTVINKMQIAKIDDSSHSLVLNGEHLSLVSLLINDKIVDKACYELTDSHLVIDTSDTVETFSLTVVTKINPIENTALEGLYKSGEAFCTQCEAEGFRRITYFLDRPDIMAVYTTKIIADKTKYPYLLSNGNKTDSGELANGKHFVTWYDPFPKPCYLFALVAGDFDCLEDSYTTTSNRQVALEIFVDKGNVAKAHHAMESLKSSMKWDEDTFGLEYDLDIYMIVAVDFFNMGAMENKGLNVFNSKYVLADSNTATDADYFAIEAVIGHEYFHNWTGNRVTCRDWFQLSLKEGLTVFRDQQFSADLNTEAVTRIQNVRLLRARQFSEDAGPMAHPIRPEKVVEMNNFYTLTVYEKGAEVIRMLNTLLGADGFRAGMDLYFKRFDGMAVTCDDFVDAMADANNKDLNLFRHWYSEKGTPLLTVEQSFENGIFKLNIKQTNPFVNSDQPLHIPINIELIDQDNQSKNNQQTLLELTELEGCFEFDGYSQMPTIAFLGGFTAPVNVDYHQSDDELVVIMNQATDSFCRWDAGQKLMTNYIKALTIDIDLALPESLLDTFKQILTEDIDPAFKAEQLTLPQFSELAEQFTELNPIVLLDAIEKLQVFLANGLSSTFKLVYQSCLSDGYEQTAIAIGERALKNICLSYLAANKQFETVESQLQHSNNMTDTLAALSLASIHDTEFLSLHMSAFENKWQDDNLVLDKWFTISAKRNTEHFFDYLESLINHPKFSLKNPNRARSLIGVFSQMNIRYFHSASGEGYRFLADQVEKLNDINPQIAAGLITPLIQFKKYDESRQLMMKCQIDRLSKLPNISKDLKEKLDAALA